MKNLPKIHDFNPPEGYFDTLPDRILGKIKPQRATYWIKYAAAASLLVISGGVWRFYTTVTAVETESLEDEISLYIESHYWTAEDVLSMVENPEEILDQIIEEEMVYEVTEVSENDQNWY